MDSNDTTTRRPLSFAACYGIPCELCGDPGLTRRRRSREYESVFGLMFIFVCVDEDLCQWRPRLPAEDTGEPFEALRKSIAGPL